MTSIKQLNHQLFIIENLEQDLQEFINKFETDIKERLEYIDYIEEELKNFSKLLNEPCTNISKTVHYTISVIDGFNTFFNPNKPLQETNEILERLQNLLQSIIVEHIKEIKNHEDNEKLLINFNNVDRYLRERVDYLIKDNRDIRKQLANEKHYYNKELQDTHFSNVIRINELLKLAEHLDIENLYRRN